MTVKQILNSLKSNRNDLNREMKYVDEYKKQNAPSHVIEYHEKRIAHYSKKIKELEEMLPAAEAAEEEKMLKKIAKEQIKEMASTIGFYEKGVSLYGITPGGKKWEAQKNLFGYTDRSVHCFTLHIQDMGVIFTSGTLDTVLQTVAQH